MRNHCIDRRVFQTQRFTLLPSYATPSLKKSERYQTRKAAQTNRMLEWAFLASSLESRQYYLRRRVAVRRSRRPRQRRAVLVAHSAVSNRAAMLTCARRREDLAG